MTLPPQVQSLVDQMVQVMGLHPFGISGFDINMDREGIVQDVKPKLIYRRSEQPVKRRANSLDSAPKCAHS